MLSSELSAVSPHSAAYGYSQGEMFGKYLRDMSHKIERKEFTERSCIDTTQYNS